MARLLVCLMSIVCVTELMAQSFYPREIGPPDHESISRPRLRRPRPPTDYPRFGPRDREAPRRPPGDRLDPLDRPLRDGPPRYMDTMDPPYDIRHDSEPRRGGNRDTWRSGPGRRTPPHTFPRSPDPGPRILGEPLVNPPTERRRQRWGDRRMSQRHDNLDVMHLQEPVPNDIPYDAVNHDKQRGIVPNGRPQGTSARERSLDFVTHDRSRERVPHDRRRGRVAHNRPGGLITHSAQEGIVAHNRQQDTVPYDRHHGMIERDRPRGTVTRDRQINMHNIPREIVVHDRNPSFRDTRGPTEPGGGRSQDNYVYETQHQGSRNNRHPPASNSVSSHSRHQARSGPARPLRVQDTRVTNIPSRRTQHHASGPDPHGTIIHDNRVLPHQTVALPQATHPDQFRFNNDQRMENHNIMMTNGRTQEVTSHSQLNGIQRQNSGTRVVIRNRVPSPSAVDHHIPVYDNTKHHNPSFVDHSEQEFEHGTAHEQPTVTQVRPSHDHGSNQIADAKVVEINTAQVIEKYVGDLGNRVHANTEHKQKNQSDNLVKGDTQTHSKNNVASSGTIKQIGIANLSPFDSQSKSKTIKGPILTQSTVDVKKKNNVISDKLLSEILGLNTKTSGSQTGSPSYEIVVLNLNESGLSSIEGSNQSSDIITALRRALNVGNTYKPVQTTHAPHPPVQSPHDSSHGINTNIQVVPSSGQEHHIRQTPQGASVVLQAPVLESTAPTSKVRAPVLTVSHEMPMSKGTSHAVGSGLSGLEGRVHVLRSGDIGSEGRTHASGSGVIFSEGTSHALGNSLTRVEDNTAHVLGTGATLSNGRSHVTRGETPAGRRHSPMLEASMIRRMNMQNMLLQNMLMENLF